VAHIYKLRLLDEILTINKALLFSPAEYQPNKAIYEEGKFHDQWIE